MNKKQNLDVKMRVDLRKRHWGTRWDRQVGFHLMFPSSSWSVTFSNRTPWHLKNVWSRREARLKIGSEALSKLRQWNLTELFRKQKIRLKIKTFSTCVFVALLYTVSNISPISVGHATSRAANYKLTECTPSFKKLCVRADSAAPSLTDLPNICRQFCEQKISISKFILRFHCNIFFAIPRATFQITLLELQLLFLQKEKKRKDKELLQSFEIGNSFSVIFLQKVTDKFGGKQYELLRPETSIGGRKTNTPFAIGNWFWCRQVQVSRKSIWLLIRTRDRNKPSRIRHLMKRAFMKHMHFSFLHPDEFFHPTKYQKYCLLLYCWINFSFSLDCRHYYSTLSSTCKLNCILKS